jgi:MYXO-CTERM domain-containing protein
MDRRRFPALGVLILLAAGASSSFASVTYSFNGTSDDGHIETFTYDSPDFLTSFTFLDSSQVTCNECSDLFLTPNNGGYDTIQYDDSVSDGGYVYFFTSGAMGSDGTYGTVISGNNATLTVTGADDPTTPEPAPLLLSAAGLAALLFLRFRRVAEASARAARV